MLVIDYRKWRSILLIAAISSLRWHEELFISDWFAKEINPGAGIYLFRCLDHRISGDRVAMMKGTFVEKSTLESGVISATLT